MSYIDTEISMLEDVLAEMQKQVSNSVSELEQQPLRYLASPEPEKGLHRQPERSRGVLVKRAHAEDFIVLEALGRVRLSEETKKAERRRLKRRYGQRKKYTFRYGRKHNKQKAKTRKEYNNRRWENDPLTRLKHTSRKPVNISKEEWDRCIGPVWTQYDRKYLKLKCNEEKMTIHNLIIEYQPPRERYARKTPKPMVVYDGYNQAVYDSFSSE